MRQLKDADILDGMTPAAVLARHEWPINRADSMAPGCKNGTVEDEQKHGEPQKSIWAEYVNENGRLL